MIDLRNGNFTTSTVNVGSAFELSSATNSSTNNTALNHVIGSGSSSEM